MPQDETQTSDRTAQTLAASRAWAALFCLVVLATLLGFSLVRAYDDFVNWPFVEAETSGDDYATLVTSLAEPDNGMSIGVLIRDLPDFERLEAVEVPVDLDLMRDSITYGERILSPIFVRAIDDMVAGKLKHVRYDPMLSPADVETLDARTDGIESGPTVLIPAREGSPQSYRLFTDPTKTRFFLLPDEATP